MSRISVIKNKYIIGPSLHSVHLMLFLDLEPDPEQDVLDLARLEILIRHCEEHTMLPHSLRLHLIVDHRASEPELVIRWDQHQHLVYLIPAFW